MAWPVRQPVVMEEARSQLVAGTVREAAQAHEDVVEVTCTTNVVARRLLVLANVVVILEGGMESAQECFSVGGNLH